MNKKFFGALLLSATILCSCSNKTTQTSTETPVDLTNHMGMYVATLPCADCPGIDTHLTLCADSTVYLTHLYQDSDNFSETLKGKWSFANDVFTVTTEDGESYLYKMISDNQLALVNETLEVKEEYKLNKQTAMTADDFVGVYNDGPEMKGGYGQALTITKVDATHVEVSIAKISGAGDGCDFKAQGKIINDQIEVNLKDVDADLQSIMTIRPTDGGTLMHVFTANSDDLYDLMKFCGGGGSLAGDYVKQ